MNFKIDPRGVAGTASVALIIATATLVALGHTSFTNPVLWLLGAILCALWAIYDVLAEMLEVQHVTGEIVSELIDMTINPQPGPRVNGPPTTSFTIEHRSRKGK